MSTLQPREKQLTTYVTVGILCVHFPLNTVAPPLQPAAPSLLPSVELSTKHTTKYTQKMSQISTGEYINVEGVSRNMDYGA